MLVSAILIIYTLVVFETRNVNCCSVFPMTAAVDVGDRISLTCIAEAGAYIDSWRLGSDANNAYRVFTNAYLDPNTGNIINSSVADGYSVNTSISGQVVLTLNSATTSQANCYYCVCLHSQIPNPFACVSVVASEPSFSATSTVIDGSPVVFNCSISFVGRANVSMTITDVMGTILNTTQDALNIQGFYNQSLCYTTIANAAVNQTHFCSVSLSNGTSNPALYSKVLAASVQWTSVRNVQVSASDPSRCIGNGQCAVNQTVYCAAQGNPTPDSFQWIILINGSVDNTDNNKNYTRLIYIGYYEIQCTAFNYIQNVRYNASGSFKTNVTVAGPPPAPPIYSESNDPSYVAKIAAPVVILGVIIIVLVIIGVIFVLKKQHKNKTFCCDQESRKPGDISTQNTETKELSNTTNANGKKSTENGIKGKNNPGYVSDETTLEENVLYSSTKNSQNTPVDTADAGYASLNEVNSKR